MFAPNMHFRHIIITCRLSQGPFLQKSAWLMVWANSQILDMAGKAWQGQVLNVIKKIPRLGRSSKMS